MATVVQVKSTQTSDAVTFDAPATAGNVLVMALADRDNNAFGSWPAGFVDAGPGLFIANARRYARMAYKLAAGGELTLDATWNAVKCVAAAWELAGVAAAPDDFVVVSNQPSSTNRNPGALVLPSGGILVTWVIDDGGAGTETGQTGVTIDAQGLHNGVEGPGFDAAHRIVAAPGSYSAGVTGTLATTWAGATLSFLDADAPRFMPRHW